MEVSKSGAERRRHERAPLLYSGSLHRDGSMVVDCVIRDLSASGARVSMECELGGRDSFILDIDGVGLFPSKIVWRRGTQAGLAFLSDPNTVKSWFNAAWGKTAAPI
jgi:hypothetical protein